MTRREFLSLLKDQLSGQMPEEMIVGQLRYYEDYIETEVRGGRREAEVLAQLGDPRLIARTLLDVEDQELKDEAQREFSGAAAQEQESGFQDSYGEAWDGFGQAAEDPYEGQDYVKRRSYRLDLSTWYGKAIVIAIAALVIIGLVLFLWILIPILLAAGLLIYIISRISRK